MSDHAVEIVEVGPLEPHPNADRLAITKVWGWQVVVSKDDFKQGSKAVYVPPDYVVPTKEKPFAFLRKNTDGPDHVRIRVCRLRQQLSQGLLVPCPEHLAHLDVGSDVMMALGIYRYEPAINVTMGSGKHAMASAPGPRWLFVPKFDVENYERYPHLIPAGTDVVITEKLHGTNAKFVYAKGKDGNRQQFCGSRSLWRYDEPDDLWWRCLRQHPQIAEFCEEYPDVVLYGEIFGPVQELRYGAPADGTVYFAAFAALAPRGWLDYGILRALCDGIGVPMAPRLFAGPFDPVAARELAEGDSSWPGATHLREGVVIVPAIEQFGPTVGRVALKMVSNRYLEKANVHQFS